MGVHLARALMIQPGWKLGGREPDQVVVGSAGRATEPPAALSVLGARREQQQRANR